jgi:D-aspartate ligase
MPALRRGDLASPPGALIVGGAHVSTAIARSLGRHGIPVWLMANHPLPTYSRYVKRSFPWPGADHADGLTSIIDVAEQHGLHGWVLIATGDQDMRMIAQNHALLSQYFCVATPDWDTAQWAYDKRLTYSRAAELAIDFPASFRAGGLDKIERLDCLFPVILKPAFRKSMDEFTQSKAWKADDRDQLLALYKRAAALVGGEAIIVQEWIPGTGESQYSYAGLWQRGEPVASLVARRRRQHPIDFGRSSTYVETIEQDEVEALAGRLLKSLNYTGVVEVEFKHDRRDGQLQAARHQWPVLDLGRARRARRRRLSLSVTALPAAANAAATLSSTWRACASNGASLSLPPSGAIGSWPETKTNPLAVTAWL